MEAQRKWQKFEEGVLKGEVMEYKTIEMTKDEIEKQIKGLAESRSHLLSEAKLFLSRLLAVIKFNKITKIAVSFYRELPSRDEICFVLMGDGKYLGFHIIKFEEVMH